MCWLMGIMIAVISHRTLREDSLPSLPPRPSRTYQPFQPDKESSDVYQLEFRTRVWLERAPKRLFPERCRNISILVV